MHPMGMQIYVARQLETLQSSVSSVQILLDRECDGQGAA